MIAQDYHQEKYKVFPFSRGWRKLCHPKKDLMTQLDSYALSTASPERAHRNTIYRDTPLAVRTPGTVVRLRRSSLHALVQQDERASDGILVGLAALTLPVVVYSFTQLWSLLAGGSLQHAVRAFLP